MRQILLIEDEPGIRNLLKLALTHAGYRVETASDGKEGIRKFDDGRFDVVITDIRMRGFSGKDVLHHVRNSAGSRPPVVGISGTPWELENKGFHATFPKPFPISSLVREVHRLCRHSVPLCGRSGSPGPAMGLRS